MDYKFVACRQLKALLNDVEQKQKRDINDYTGGHLNGSYLRQPATLSAHKGGWKTSEKTIRSLEKSTNKTYKPLLYENENRMSDILYQFTVGTSCGFPYKNDKLKSTPKVLVLKDQRQASFNSKKPDYIQDGVYVEELDNKHIYIPSPKQMSNWGEKSDSHVESKPEDVDKSKQLNSLHHVSLQQKQTFMPSQAAGITKKDQYSSYKSFEKNIIYRKDQYELKAFSGNSTAVNPNTNFKKAFKAVKLHGKGPSFHRLHIYMNSFDDVIEKSQIFQPVLYDIKIAFDEYIEKLLDTQTCKHQVLREQISKMTETGTSKPQELEQIKSKVENMETQGKWLVQENERLCSCLKEGTELLLNTPESEQTPRKMVVYQEDTLVELADELEHYKALLLEKLDALNSLHTTLRNDHVPLNVCTHLEQCIKETEVEVQKLLKQNEYFERSIADMEEDLREAIKDADTSEKDARRIWRKVNSTRAQPGEDHEDEGKWNWYIS